MTTWPAPAPSPILRSSNLNPETAAALGEMFGYGNLTAFSQITELLRKGHLVDHEGQDTYLPQVSRLKLPIARITGGASSADA